MKIIYTLRLIFILLFFITTEVHAQYCIGTYQNTCSGAGAYINKFTFNTLSNSTSGCNGNINNYILYPAVGSNTTVVQIGSSYQLTMKSGSGSGSSQGFGVWIDFNNDGDFNETNEFVFASPTVGSILFSGTVAIPNDESYIGERRVRVRSAKLVFVYENDACVDFDNGETEDYTITINPAPACTEIPDAGTLKAFPSSLCQPGQNSELELTGFTVASGLLFEWQRSPDGLIWSNIIGATNHSYITPPIDTTSSFRVKVTCLNSDKSDISNVVTIEIGTSLLTSYYGDSICGEGNAIFFADCSSGEINWYADPFGGIPLLTESAPSTFQSFIDSTTTFFVTASTGVQYIDSVGMADSSNTSGTDFYENEFLKFNVLRNCTLVGVNVYPSTSGEIFIQLRDQFFNVIISDTFEIDESQLGNKVFLEMNYSLSNGNDYQLFLSDESISLWSSQSNVHFPYEIPNVISIYNSNLGPAYYFYFYNWIINYSEQCESVRVPVTSVVEEAPSLIINSIPENAIMCANSTDSIELIATSSLSNYLWSPTDGLKSIADNIVHVHPAVTTTYTVSATDGTCNNSVSYTVTVANTPEVSITTTSDSICGGASTQLNAVVTPQQNYIVSQINYAPDFSELGTEVELDDEEVSEGLPIGFEFKFYDTEFEEFHISSNGFITFNDDDFDGCCTGQFLPSVNPPNNLIAFAWEDLSPDLGGKIIYRTTGVSPYRKLTVEFDSIPHYSVNDGGVDLVTAQVMLYETTNVIEIHITAMPGNPNGNWFFHTEGIENAEGNLAASVPLRNASNLWTAYDDAWRFTPQEYKFQWSPSVSLNNDTVDNPIASPLINTWYSVTVTDAATNCSAEAVVEIAVNTTPVAGVVSELQNTFCDKGSTQLTLTGYSGGATIQWQNSLNGGGPYTDIAGATNSIYQTPVLTSSTYYVAKVSCINTSVSDESFVEIVTSPPPPVVSDVSRCSPGTVTLINTGNIENTIWYDAQIGGNNIGTGDTIISPTVNQSTNFYAENNLGGCLSERVAANVSVYYPIIKASVTDSSICTGDTLMLLAENNGEGNFYYQWYPLLPIMIPADGTGDSVITVPVQSTLFTLIANEINNECDTIIEVPVNLFPTPHVTATGLPDTMLVTDSPTLLQGDPSGGVFTGPGIFNGEFFDPSIPGVGGPYAINYSYTNFYGCSDDTVLYVVVETGVGISKTQSNFFFSVSPNPATEKITIQLSSSAANSKLFICDNLGRIILERKITSLTSVIDISGFSAGIYFVKVNGLVKKVVVE